MVRPPIVHVMICLLKTTSDFVWQFAPRRRRDSLRWRLMHASNQLPLQVTEKALRPESEKVGLVAHFLLPSCNSSQPKHFWSLPKTFSRFWGW